MTHLDSTVLSTNFTGHISFIKTISYLGTTKSIKSKSWDRKCNVHHAIKIWENVIIQVSILWALHINTGNSLDLRKGWHVSFHIKCCNLSLFEYSHFLKSDIRNQNVLILWVCKLTTLEAFLSKLKKFASMQILKTVSLTQYTSW